MGVLVYMDLIHDSEVVQSGSLVLGSVLKVFVRVWCEMEERDLKKYVIEAFCVGGTSCIKATVSAIIVLQVHHPQVYFVQQQEFSSPWHWKCSLRRQRVGDCLWKKGWKVSNSILLWLYPSCGNQDPHNGWDLCRPMEPRLGLKGQH